MTHKMQWVAGPEGELQTVAVETPDDLERLLKELEREALANPPFMVDLLASDGSGVGIGLGRGISVAHYVSKDGNPPYFISMGTFDDMPESIVYYAGGHWTEFPGICAIPYEDAKAATEEFFMTAHLPTGLRWRET